MHTYIDIIIFFHGSEGFPRNPQGNPQQEEEMEMGGLILTPCVPKGDVESSLRCGKTHFARCSLALPTCLPLRRADARCCVQGYPCTVCAVGAGARKLRRENWRSGVRAGVLVRMGKQGFLCGEAFPCDFCVFSRPGWFAHFSKLYCKALSLDQPTP